MGGGAGDWKERLNLVPTHGLTQLPPPASSRLQDYRARARLGSLALPPCDKSLETRHLTLFPGSGEGVRMPDRKGERPVLSKASNLGRWPTLSSAWNHVSPKPKVQRLRKQRAALLDKEEWLRRAGDPSLCGCRHSYTCSLSVCKCWS